MPELVLYGIRLLAPALLGKLWTNESAVMSDLDQWEWTRLWLRLRHAGPVESSSPPGGTASWANSTHYFSQEPAEKWQYSWGGNKWQSHYHMYHWALFSNIWTEERDRDNAANMYILDLLESQPSTYTTYKLYCCNVISLIMIIIMH